MVSQLAYPPSLPQLLVDEAVRSALLEDLGRAGDIAANATLPEDATARAVLSSREARNHLRHGLCPHGPCAD